jgi:hypothetical protein
MLAVNGEANPDLMTESPSSLLWSFLALYDFSLSRYLLHNVQCPTRVYHELAVGKGTKDSVCVAFAVPLVI